MLRNLVKNVGLTNAIRNSINNRYFSTSMLSKVDIKDFDKKDFDKKYIVLSNTNHIPTYIASTVSCNLLTIVAAICGFYDAATTLGVCGGLGSYWYTRNMVKKFSPISISEDKIIFNDTDEKRFMRNMYSRLGAASISICTSSMATIFITQFIRIDMLLY